MKIVYIETNNQANL